MVFQMPGDGVRPGIQSFAGKSLAQLDDQIDGGLRQAGRAGVRAPGVRLECGLALEAVTGHQTADPALRDPVFAGHLRLAATLDDNSGDD
jgi:hypothetical protein